jgi:toxin CcdB
MARFEVFANPDASERRHTPYFVDVQNDYISHLATRVVIPLRRETSFGPRPQDLNPPIQFGNDKLVLDTAAIGAVPISELRKALGSLRADRAEIHTAMDALFGSY